MDKATSWQASESERNFRYVDIQGVGYYQRDHAGGPLTPADPQTEPRSTTRTVLAPVRSRNESQCPTEYTTPSSRDNVNAMPTYGSVKEPRASRLQTRTNALFPRNETLPGKDPRTPEQQISQTPVYTLFPREDGLQRNDDSPPVHHSPVTTPYSILSRTSDSQALDRRTSRQSAGNQLSSLAQAFCQIGLGDFASCERFIMGNSAILDEDVNRLLQNAQRLPEEGRTHQVRALVQKVVLLRNCAKMPREDVGVYLTQMTRSDPTKMEQLSKDCEKILSYLKKGSFPVRRHVTEQGPPSASGRVVRPSALEQVQQSQSPENEGSRTTLFGVGSVFQDLTIGDQIRVRGQKDSGTADTRQVHKPNPAARISEDNPRRPPSPSSPMFAEIRGRSGDVELLDSRYYRRPDPKKFFVVGRVFALLWHESAGSTKSGTELSLPRYATRGKYGEQVFSHIRRMVVVRQRHGYFWCIAINTYGGQGILKHGLSDRERQAHAVIYSSDTTPSIKAGERDNMNKKPIAVNMASADQKLDAMSRLNFSRPYSVEWNVKVMDIGNVAPSSMPEFTAYWQSELTDD